MTTADFSTTLFTDQSPELVFDAINNIRAWWSEDFKGDSRKPDNVFEVRFGDVHYSRQQLTELIPGARVAWLVTDSELNFLRNKSEWTGTRIFFDISREEGQTQILFRHQGLVPAIECFADCSKGWTYYLQSLLQLINTGKGQPNTQ